MERTEIVSLFKNTPADGTEITVCGWAKNIRDSKNIGFIALSDGGCFKTLQVVLAAGKLANYDEVIHTGLYSRDVYKRQALSCAALSGPDGPRYFSRSLHLTFKK